MSLTQIVAILLQGSGVDPAQWPTLHAKEFVAAPLAFHARRPNIHVMRYEDLVAHRYDGLSRYLGVTLVGQAQVKETRLRVVRTKASGDWVNWFTPSDIAQWEPLLRPYMENYYLDASWDLPAAPALSASTGSDYVARLINDRRAILGLAPVHRDESGF